MAGHQYCYNYCFTSSNWISLSYIGTSAPVLLDTNTFFTHSHPWTASSTTVLRGMVFPPRMASSAVITTLASADRENEKQKKVRERMTIREVGGPVEKEISIYV